MLTTVAPVSCVPLSQSGVSDRHICHYPVHVLLTAGCRACLTHRGPPLQVIHAVAIENRMLQPPEGTPPQVARLMRACMAQDVAKRPPFDQIVRDLERISMDLGASGALVHEV